MRKQFQLRSKISALASGVYLTVGDFWLLTSSFTPEVPVGQHTFQVFIEQVFKSQVAQSDMWSQV